VFVTVRRPIAAVAVAAWALSMACASSPESSLDDRTYATTDAALERVAVIPFYTHRTFEYARLRGGVPKGVARERMTQVIVDAFALQGVELVPSAEVGELMAGVVRLTPAVDARIFAEIADREFGATGILLGEVLRYWDVSGSSSAARRPASVAFHLALYDAPEGRKIWAARFDETQTIHEPDLVNDPDDVTPPDPWLSADEIARAGAAAAAEALLGTREGE